MLSTSYSRRGGPIKLILFNCASRRSWRALLRKGSSFTSHLIGTLASMTCSAIFAHLYPDASGESLPLHQTRPPKVPPLGQAELAAYLPPQGAPLRPVPRQRSMFESSAASRSIAQRYMPLV